MDITMAKIQVLDTQIAVVQDEYISLTDIAKYKNPQDANNNFNPIEFDGIRKEVGLNR